ncbi:MAG: tetratricopeptide repeat protein [Planctomycetota bacterium]
MGGGLLGFVLALGSSCALIPGQGFDEEVLRIDLELGAVEAACLVAERLALDFTSIDRDPLRPKARVLKRGGGRFRIHYQRAAGRSFLPQADGYFLRDHVLHDGERSFRASIPESPLGKIRFIDAPTTSAPDGCLERITVDVEPLEPNGARVVISCAGGDYGDRRRRTDALQRLLSFVESLKRAFSLAASNQTVQALSCIDRAVGNSFAGFTTMHDPLVAQAYMLKAKLLLARGQRLRAEQALRQARLIAPDSSKLAEFHAELMDDRARPESVHDALDRASMMAIPGSLRERKLRSSRRRTSSYSSFNSSMTRARAELSGEDWQGAEEWANRALDRRPGHPAARSLLADALERMRRFREGRDLRLLVCQPDIASERQIQALAENLIATGDASLGLRWLIRFQKKHPNLLATTRSRLLFRSVGWEHCVRAMKIEGLGEESLPLLLAWMEEEPSHQRWFLARLLLATVLREAERAQVFGSMQVETVEEDGASGVRSLHPASPNR